MISLLFVFIVCSFFGKDFKSIGRHAWRCKEKAKSREKDRNNANTIEDSCCKTSVPVVDTELSSSTCVLVKCRYGKNFIGQRSLKMNQWNHLKKKLTKFLGKIHLHIEFRFVFQSVKRIENFFPFQDRAPNHVRSSVAHTFTCSSCKAT